MKKRTLSLLLAILLTFSILAGISFPVQAAGTVKSGCLTLATCAGFPPYVYSQNGKLYGIEIEVAREIANKMGLSLEVISTTFDGIFEALSTGSADIGMSGIPTLAELTAQDSSYAELGDLLEFSTPFVTNTQSIVVRTGSSITSSDILHNGTYHTIGAKTNSWAETSIRDNLVSQNLCSLKTFTTAADALTALQNGQVDCLMLDKAVAASVASGVNGISILNDNSITQSYTIIMTKGNSTFSTVNSALNSLINDGTVQTIINKYLFLNEKSSAPVTPIDPVTPEDPDDPVTPVTPDDPDDDDPVIPIDPYFVNPFTDVSANDWFYSDVMKAVQMKLVNGKTPTTFVPKGNLKICEAIKLAACMNQYYYNNGSVTLTNSTSGAWYTSYVDYAISKGIIYSTQFIGRYNSIATRAEFVTIFANALPYKEFTAINTIQDNAIPDVKLTDSYGAAVYKMYRAGILTGSGNAGTKNWFLPNNSIARREVAAIITRMMDKTARLSVTLY